MRPGRQPNPAKLLLMSAAPSERPSVTITYCTGCRWMLRAAWMAQELLSTLEQELSAVSLVPGSGGVFEIRVEETLVWSRERQGGFPEIKVLKQLVRDEVAPTKDLGHADRAASQRTQP